MAALVSPHPKRRAAAVGPPTAPVCTNLGCKALADVRVAPGVLLCGRHGLFWYRREYIRGLAS